MATPDSDAALPVLVVGAGPVGQTVAALLAHWGVGVRLLEARSVRDAVGSKAICHARDVLDIWDVIGVGESLAEEGTTWTTARTFFKNCELASWQFQDRGRSAFPPFVNIGQERTEALLDAALGRLGVVTEWGTELLAVHQTANDVIARFRGPVGESEIRGAYLVIATGARSDAIREQLGLEFAGESFDDPFLICDIKANLPGWETERRFYFDPEWNPGRQVLIHACPGSTYRIDWQVPADYDLAQDEASGGLDQRIKQIIGTHTYEIVWKSVYRFHSRQTERMQVGRVLLAGDVAHLVSPFGARGLNSGIFDAENAAWKVAFASKGWAGPRLIESYDAERTAAARENIAVTSTTMRFLVPQDEEASQQRRRVLMAALADPSSARDVDSGRFAEPFWYVDSPLTTSDPVRPFEGRPPKGSTPAPAPGILVPDLPVTLAGRPDVRRLRQLFRGGLTVLVTEADEAATVIQSLRKVTAAPVETLALSQVCGGANIMNVLAMQPGEAWIVRPDAYVAAVVPAADIETIETATSRVLGFAP